MQFLRRRGCDAAQRSACVEKHEALRITDFHRDEHVTAGTGDRVDGGDASQWGTAFGGGPGFRNECDAEGRKVQR
jgi:hypothetical protein